MLTTNNSYDFSSSTDYILNLRIKNEIEWENDHLDIYTICQTCDNNHIGTISGNDYNWHELYYPISNSEEFRKISINFITDQSLDYRGINIDHLAVLKKPVLGYCDIGDLNQDGIIDIIDIVRTINIIFYNTYNSYELCVSDSNDDNVINVIDIVAIVNIIFGN